jgi:hypothetical protein
MYDERGGLKGLTKLIEQEKEGQASKEQSKKRN